MKRFLSRMLLLILLTAMLPVDALAFEDSYTLSAKEVKTISDIAGTNSVYREGMKYSAAMSAYQKYCWLLDFGDNELAKVKNQCGALLMDDNDAAKTPEFKAIYRAVNEMDQLVQYWASDLDREITAVESAQTMLQCENAYQSETAKAYRRLTRAKERISRINREMSADDPSDFSAKTDQWFAALREIHEQYVTPAPPREIPTTDSEFHIVILNANEIGVELHTPDGNPVSGAKVTLSSGDVTEDLTSTEGGYVVFNTAAFKLDQRNRMWGNLYVQKDGLRIYESHGCLMTGGEGIKIIMEPDDGTPYVQYLTFRETDILHGTETIQRTSKNTADQSFRVGIHINPGQKGTFSIDYVDNASGKPAHLEAEVSGDDAKNNLQVLKFDRAWCSILAPGENVQIGLVNKASNASLFTRSCGIETKEAVTPMPHGNLPKSQQGPGMGFNLNIQTGSKYILPEINIGLSIPKEIANRVPFHFAMSPEGDFVLAAAYAKARKISEDMTDSGWQTVNSEKQFQKMDDFYSDRQSFKDLATSQAKDNEWVEGMNMFSRTFQWQVALSVTGKLKRDNDHAQDAKGPYTGRLDAFFSFAFDITISGFQPFMPWGIPFFLGTDFSFGVLTGVDLPVSFKTQNTNTIVIGDWYDVHWLLKEFDIIISSRLQISVYAGVGVKGLASIYVKGYIAAAFAFHIRPLLPSDQIVGAEISVSAGFDIVGELLFSKVSVSIIKGKWEDYAPKESQKDAGSGDGAAAEDPVRYVQAEVKDVGKFEDVKNIRTVQSGSSFYSFYVKDTLISGETRPWLRCSVISNDGTVTEMPLPHLGEKALASIGTDRFPSDMYVCAFDVASLKGVYNKDNGVEVIALDVIFARKENQFIYMETYFLYRRPGGAMQQANYLIHRGVVNIYGEEEEKIGCISITICPHRGNPDEGVQNFSAMCAFIGNDYPLIFDAYQQDFQIDSGTHNVTIQNISPGNSSYGIVPKRDFERIEQLELVREDPETSNAFIIAKKRDSEERVFIGVRLKADLVQYKQKIEGDICSFKCLPVSSKPGVTVALIHDADITGRCAISLTDFRTASKDKWPTFTELSQIVTNISPAYYDLVDLGRSRALYYMETSVSDGNKADGHYDIKAIYFADGNDGKVFASHPFHLAEFKADDLKIDNGAGEMRISVNNSEFLHGTVLERDSDPEKYYYGTIKYFRFKQTMQVDLQKVLVEDVFTKPGEKVNLLFPMLNNGNVPISKLRLSVYAVLSGSEKKIPLADIHIDCVDPEKSSAIDYDTDGEVLSSAEGLRAVSQFNAAVGNSMDTFIVGKASSPNAYATNVLMPDEMHVYRSSFTVPKDFKAGDYTIYVTPTEYSTLVRPDFFGAYDATGAWATTLKNLDSNKKLFLSAATDDRPLTLTAYVRDDCGSADETVPVTLKLSDSEGDLIPLAEDSDLLRAFADTIVTDREEVDLNFADLSIGARLSREAEREIVHIVIRNESASPMENIKLTCDVDGDDCYSYDFGDGRLLYRDTVNVDVPLEKLTSGRKGEQLNLHIAGSGNDVNLHNNSDSVPLMEDFIITRNPSDQYVAKGARAKFSVRARGGEEPYEYQWQVSMDGRDGTYRNIDGANESELIIRKARLEQNGAYVRCLVRDRTGEILVSNPALLLVKKAPHTGDATNVGIILALMLGSAAVIVFLILRRRRA